MRKEKWIIEAYRMADDQEKLDMYMTCRDHRGAFDEIETGSSILEQKTESLTDSKPARARWNCCGRLRRAFGG